MSAVIIGTGLQLKDEKVINAKLNAEIQRLQPFEIDDISYKLLRPEYDMIKFHHDNMRRYLKIVSGMSDTELRRMEAYEK